MQSMGQRQEQCEVQADDAVVAEIQRRYADHLYSKRDHDAAMTQYLATIGHLEASFVIRKFLDAQRIHNLTSYLEALHAKVLPPTRLSPPTCDLDPACCCWEHPLIIFVVIIIIEKPFPQWWPRAGARQ